MGIVNKMEPARGMNLQQIRQQLRELRQRNQASDIGYGPLLRIKATGNITGVTEPFPGHGIR